MTHALLLSAIAFTCLPHSSAPFTVQPLIIASGHTPCETLIRMGDCPVNQVLKVLVPLAFNLFFLIALNRDQE